MGKSKELATGAVYVDASGDTMTGRLTVRGDTLGSTFENAAYGNGVRVEQSSYTADNYVSLIEAPYTPNYSSAGAHVRIGAKFSGAGSSLVMGTSDAYGSGITNTALGINPQGRVTMPQQPHIFGTPGNGVNGGSGVANRFAVLTSQGGLAWGSSGITVPVAGIYLITFQTITRNGTTGRVDTTIRINGTVRNSGLNNHSDGSVSDYRMRTHVMTEKLSANDYIGFDHNLWYSDGNSYSTWQTASVTLLG